MKNGAQNREQVGWSPKRVAGNTGQDTGNRRQATGSNQQEGFGAPVRRRRRNYAAKILKDPLVMNA